MFIFCCRRAKGRPKNTTDTRLCQQKNVETCDEFRKFDGEVKGLGVDENGQNAVYTKDLEHQQLKVKVSKVVLNLGNEEAQENVNRNKKYQIEEVKDCDSQVLESVKPNQLVPYSSPSSLKKEVEGVRQPPPPPPPPPPLHPPPPLSPLTPARPPMLAKNYFIPPHRAGALVSSSKPPLIPTESTNTVGHVKKLKPLHWDKVIANTDHSMVWNEIVNGSLRFDDDQIETLFGYTTTTSSSKTLQGNKVSSRNRSSSSSSRPSTKIFILDSRKSQNTAIVLKSLAISRKEIIDSILEGDGLPIDVLEKLVRISPTKEEEAKILQFKGSPSELADAESFLYHILKAVPSAFVRINAMLFRYNYDAETLHLNESLQTLELACKELRSRGLFLKLLEAILKAGNKMNAGTSRGNAQGFNLTALRNLSDIKSTDGKTTLLHFVVEQVARSEGRRRFINQNTNLGGTNNDLYSETMASEYILLGLQALGELGIEFSNVKKAAMIEYESFSYTSSSLTARVEEIGMLITGCSNGRGDGFVREMGGFLGCCEEELKVVDEEQTRIMELVKRTTSYYYRAATSKHERENLLQLFVIVKDFLEMVDQVCLDISKKIQKKNVVAGTAGSTSPPPLTVTNWGKFEDFRLHLVSDSSITSSFSDSDDDF